MSVNGKFKYIINKTTKKGSRECSVLLYYHFGTKKRFRRNVKIKISDFNNWNKLKEQIKKNELNALRLNKRLNYLKEQFLDMVENHNIENKGDLSLEILNSFMDDILNINKKRDKKSNNLLELIEDYSKGNNNNGKKFSKSTIYTHNQTKNLLSEFNSKINFNDITLDFHSKFIDFLTDEKDFRLNTIGMHIKNLICFMNFSLERGYHSNQVFKMKSFYKPFEKSESCYLNEDELKKIYELDLDNVKSIRIKNGLSLTSNILKRARDLFLISCFTGLRANDYTTLNENNIIKKDNRSYIRKRNKKTGKYTTIPISKYVSLILKKNNGKFPLNLKPQKINYAIKEICRIANIDELIEVKYIKKGVTVIDKKPKYEFISNHTGRRSFCTNAFLADVPVIDIMFMSGHKTEKAFRRYIKADDIQKAQKIANHNFFN